VKKIINRPRQFGKATEALNKRVKEIGEMTDKELIGSFEYEAGIVYMATKEIRTRLAQNTRKDLELIKEEIFKRLTVIVNRQKALTY